VRLNLVLRNNFRNLSKTFDYRSDSESIVDKRHSFVFEPIFTLCICIFLIFLGKMLRFQKHCILTQGVFNQVIFKERVETFRITKEREEDEVPADVNGTHSSLDSK